MIKKEISKPVSMKIFNTVQKHLALIGYRANQSPFNSKQLSFIFLGLVSVSSLCIYLFFVANTRKEYMDSILMTASGFLVLFSNLSTAPKTATIFIFINKIEYAINNRLKYAKSERMYKRTHRLVEKLCKIAYLIIVKLFAPAVVLPKAIYSFFLYFTTDLGPDAFELPIPAWMPFDWKNPIGYLIVTFVHCHVAALPVRYIECFLTLGLAGLLFSFSLVKDVKYSLRLFNKMVKTKHTRSELLESIFEIIRFINLRELVGYIVEIYSITLMALFMGCTGAICLTMLTIQVDFFQSHNHSVVLLESIFVGIFALNLVFITSEIGERLTSNFFGIEEKLYQLDWYLYPVQIKRMLIPMMIYVQRPVEIVFFGSLSCSRQQFKQVINTGYSCFMLLRKFYE